MSVEKQVDFQAEGQESNKLHGMRKELQNVQNCWSIMSEKDWQGENHSRASVFSPKEKQSFPQNDFWFSLLMAKDQITEMVPATLSPSSLLLELQPI